MHNGKPKIVIIGAGAAGLAAAEKLHASGLFEIKLLEAQGRIGGRVYSQQSSTLGSADFVELGAQWIHGEDHPVYEFAKAQGLVLEKSKDSLVDEDEATGEFVLDSGRQITDDEDEVSEDCLQFLNTLLTKVEQPNNFTVKELQEWSMGDYLEEQFRRYLNSFGPSGEKDARLRRAVFDWFLRNQLVDNSCFDMKQLSLRAFSDYVLEGDTTVRLRVPLSTLLDRITPTFPRNQISLHQPVRKIVYSTAGTEPIKVVSQSGLVVEADHVIMTASLGVLKASPEMFEPPLPTRKRKAIDSCGFGSVTKLLLEFPTAFWERLQPPTDGFELLWLDSGDRDFTGILKDAPWQRSVVGFDLVRSTKNTLVVWLAGPKGPEVDNMPDDQVMEDAWRLLCKFIGSDEVPKPVRLIRERWSANPFTRGTYSYYSLDSSRAGIVIGDLAEPVGYHSATTDEFVPALLFAGEATHPQFFSTVHGAILSGWREADRLIELHS
ncbi:Spermine oxidase [Hypsibius exemplaris]|uniref:Spermine oxidase n=1 Tax=Hypsibius exemplaris TaxID=2072580 RepID=A0A1W0X0S9_HYPEX|nr:Spermine oxidase [Hypsibius exemplaris]